MPTWPCPSCFGPCAARWQQLRCASICCAKPGHVHHQNGCRRRWEWNSNKGRFGDFESWRSNDAMVVYISIYLMYFLSLSLYFFYMILYVDIIMQQKFSEVCSQSTCGTWIFLGWKSALCRKLEPYFGHTWTPPSWLLWLMLRKRLHHLGVKRNRCELETFFHWWNLVNFMYYRCCSDIIRKCQFWYGVGPGWLMIWDESLVGWKFQGDWKPSLDWLNWAVGDVTWSWDWGRPVLGWSSLVEIIH